MKSKKEIGRWLYKNSNGNHNRPNNSVSTVVSIPVCHTGDRGSIPRQRELLQPNTRPHQITVSIFDVSKINPEENVADDCKENQGGNDIQLNISVREVVKTPVCHVVDRGSILRK